MATGISRLALTVLLTASALAQQPQTSPDSSTPTLKVKSQLTVEDVTVTDGKGKPVHGLTQSDFTVKEDGKPQDIKNFQEYGTEQPQTASPQLPPNVYTNQQATATSAVNLLLFDNVTTGLAGDLFRASENLMFARQQAIKYLNTMPPGTQVAVLEMSTGLHVVQAFTSDRDLLLAAVNSLKPELVPGTYVNPPTPKISACDILRAMNAQSAATTDALTAVAGFVSGMKDRKNLIWFTPGIPWLTDYPRFSLMASRVPCALNDYSPALHKAYGLLAAGRVAVYPVDPRGLQQGTPATDENGSLLPLPPGVAALSDIDSMQDVAKSTGGVAYYNRNDLDAAMGEAIATGADYYSLSYVPPLSKSDGKYHTIDVQVDRPGLHLQYREGYTALDVPQPLAVEKKNPGKPSAPPVSDFHAAMGYGKPDVSELPFNVQVHPSAQASNPGGPSSPAVIGSLNPKLKGMPLVRYDFLYELPAGAITLTGDDPAGIRKGSVEFVIVAYGADGEPLNSLGQTATFSIKPDRVAQFMQQPARIPVQLDLPPGKVWVRVGVLDVPSQKMGIVEIPQTVAEK